MTNTPKCLPALVLAALTACAAPGQGGPTLALTPSLTPTASATPTTTATRRPTAAATPPPSERDDHPARLLPAPLGPGGFLSWEGSVAALFDDQDWLAIYVPPGAEPEVTFDVQLQCGGGDTARVGLFEAAVTAGVDSDGDGKLSFGEALETGAVVAEFDMGCLEEVSATVSGGADYYLVVYAAAGGETGYALYLDR